MKYKNVIVTGGCGFIGSHVVDALVKEASRVVVIDKAKPNAAWKNAKAKYKRLNILDEKLAEVIAKEKPELVVHLAAHIHDRESVREPIMNANNNIIGSLNLLEAVRAGSKAKIVFTSSGIIYGNQEKFPIKEDAVARPITPYAISKLAVERYLHFYHEVHSVPYVALRPGNVYGSRQDSSAESGAIGIFATQLMRGEQAYIYNDGQTIRDYIYIDDVVAAILRAAETDFIGVLNIGTGLGTDTNAIFEATRNAVGSQAAAESREDVNDVVRRIELDISKAKKELKWQPQVKLEEGIESTAQWYRDNI